MTLEPLIQAPLVVQAHVATVMAALACGLWLIFPSRKGARAHRIVGFTFMGLMLVTTVISFFIHRRMPNSPVFGLSPAHVMSILVLFSIWRALDAAHKRDVRRHRVWATALFGGALVVNGLMNVFLFSGISHDIFFRP
jgi:uncharacterized membrane protein